MRKPRVLIFGFSNVVLPGGFSTVLTDMVANSQPDVEIVRIGMGAMQPHVVPVYLRKAVAEHGPFSHVLFEINSSAFTQHVLSSEDMARDILLDITLSTYEMGATPLFLLLYRDWGGRDLLNFNSITRRFCAEMDIRMLDLAEAVIAERGRDFMHALLRDATHTTQEGSEFQAERTLPFLLYALDSNTPLPALETVRRPRLRCGVIESGVLWGGLPHVEKTIAGLTDRYARLAGTDETEQILPKGTRAQGLIYLFHSGGGHADLTVNRSSKPMRLTSIDPHSHYTRIGVLPFDTFRAISIRRLQVGKMTDATEVTLRKREKALQMDNFLGPLLTVRRDTV